MGNWWVAKELYKIRENSMIYDDRIFLKRYAADELIVDVKYFYNNL